MTLRSSSSHAPPLTSRTSSSTCVRCTAQIQLVPRTAAHLPHVVVYLRPLHRSDPARPTHRRSPPARRRLPASAAPLRSSSSHAPPLTSRTSSSTCVRCTAQIQLVPRTAAHLPHVVVYLRPLHRSDPARPTHRRSPPARPRSRTTRCVVPQTNDRPVHEPGYCC